MNNGRKTVYNKSLVTIEKWKNVNEENKELLYEFLDYKRATSKSGETIKQYEAMLKIFFVWVLEKAKNKHFTEVNKRDYIKFQGYCLNDLGHSPARIRTIRSSISSLGLYVENILDDIYEDFRNIINKIEAPVKNTVREKTIITFEECEAVANRLLEDGNIQLACYLTVACYSGLRKQELTRLLVKDFTTNINMQLGDSFYKTSPIKVKGRGNKTMEKYVWNKCDKWLKLWLKHREENNIRCEYLFCRKTEDGYKQILVATANSYATTLSRYFGRVYYNHCTRHALATELTRAGLPIDVIQFLLSHQSAETSKLYIDISDSENMEQFSDFFSGKNAEIVKKGLGDL